MRKEASARRTALLEAWASAPDARQALLDAPARDLALIGVDLSVCVPIDAPAQLLDAPSAALLDAPAQRIARGVAFVCVDAPVAIRVDAGEQGFARCVPHPLPDPMPADGDALAPADPAVAADIRPLALRLPERALDACPNSLRRGSG